MSVFSVGDAAVDGDAPARRRGVSCDSWDRLFSLVTAVSQRNTPSRRSLAHLV
jgi:hypothetical protein